MPPCQEPLRSLIGHLRCHPQPWAPPKVAPVCHRPLSWWHNWRCPHADRRFFGGLNLLFQILWSKQTKPHPHPRAVSMNLSLPGTAVTATPSLSTAPKSPPSPSAPGLRAEQTLKPPNSSKTLPTNFYFWFKNQTHKLFHSSSCSSFPP